MSEQKQEEKKEESREEKEENKVVVMNRKRYNPKYHTKEFTEKLGTYYVSTQNYAETARMLNNEFGTNISKDQVKYIYFKKMSKKITMDPKAGEFFDDAFNRMKQRWEEAWKLIGWLSKQAQGLMKLLDEETEAKRIEAGIKLIPQLTQLVRSMQEQLTFIQKQQEQIKIQQETLIFSPGQINAQITPILKTLIEEGKIQILQDIPEWKIKKKKQKEE